MKYQLTTPPPPLDVLLARYLVHCCAYYHFGTSLVSDIQFDREAKVLANNWEKVKHPDRKLVDPEALRNGGSGYYIRFTLQIINATQYIIRKQQTV